VGSLESQTQETHISAALRAPSPALSPLPFVRNTLLEKGQFDCLKQRIERERGAEYLSIYYQNNTSAAKGLRGARLPVSKKVASSCWQGFLCHFLAHGSALQQKGNRTCEPAPWP
jgi:hypothetical protein